MDFADSWVDEHLFVANIELLLAVDMQFFALLPPANEIWGKVMCLSFCPWGSLYDDTSCLAPMFLLWGLCPWSHVPSGGMGVSVQGVFVRGISAQRGCWSLSRGTCISTAKVEYPL